jgi:general secretion pathway protein D
MLNHRKVVRAIAVATCALVLAACAAERHHKDGLRLIAEGKREEGIKEISEAQKLEPTNPQYRMSYMSQQALFVREQLEKGDTARSAGKADDAREFYAAVLRVEPKNDRATRGLTSLDMDKRHRGNLDEAEKLLKSGKLELARERVRTVIAENPANGQAHALQRTIDEQVEKQRLARQAQIAADSVMRKPVTLQFRDANLRMVFEALSRTTGLNVIFDREVKNDLKTTIFVTNAAVEDTVDLILLQNQLDKKVLNANTMFIYPSTAAKQKEYQDLKVRTFMLSNADPKYLQNVLKTILKIKDVVIDERTGALVIRDTPEAIAVAEKLVAAHDVADPEVMLEVEVLEVSRDRLSELGIKWPDKVTVSVPDYTGSGNTVGDLRYLKSSDLQISALSAAINFKLQDTDAKILASPRIRARHKEKARIMIGDRVPIITNSVTPLQTGSSVVTGSVQYLDVGLKLEVEPQVYAEGEVGIKISLEVSNIAKELPGPNGSLAYQIGTRTAQTNLRLRDGETQILAGLISNLDRSTSAKVPGIGQLPMLGRLFANDGGTNTQSEIMLSITPRIVRAMATTDAGLSDVYSGTETLVKDRPLQLDPIGSLRDGSPGSGSNVAPAPAAQPVVRPPVVAPAAAPAAAPGVAPAPATSTSSPAPQGAPSVAPTQTPAPGVTPSAQPNGFMNSNPRPVPGRPLPPQAPGSDGTTAPTSTEKPLGAIGIPQTRG